MAKHERKGNRKTRDSFETKSPDLGYYYIVTDTNETEQNYFQGLKDSLPTELQGRLVIKVSKAKTTELVNVCKEQSTLIPQYCEPWIVFDRDRVVGFDEIIKKAHKEKIRVGWSNPCIEIWFDSYFGKMHAYHDSVICCREFGVTFERKTGQEYKKSNRQIYSILNRYGDETAGIQIAENRLQGYLRSGIKTPSEMCPCTTVHQLISEIKEKTERN